LVHAGIKILLKIRVVRYICLLFCHYCGYAELGLSVKGEQGGKDVATFLVSSTFELNCILRPLLFREHNNAMETIRCQIDYCMIAHKSNK
jgi:hypothetical protein